MNKKGIAIEKLIAIALVIGAVIAITLTTDKLIASSKDELKFDMCKLSAQKAVASENILEFTCDKAEMTITQEEIDQDKAKKRIAENMRQCWEIFQQGELDPFDKELVGVGDTVCFQCAEIKFDNNVRTGNIPNFKQFLSEETIRNREEKYTSFLYPNVENYTALIENNLDTTRTYYVMYQAFSEDRMTIPWSDVIFNNADSSVMLMTQDKFNQLRCDHVLE